MLSELGDLVGLPGLCPCHFVSLTLYCAHLDRTDMVISVFSFVTALLKEDLSPWKLLSVTIARNQLCKQSSACGFL